VFSISGGKHKLCEYSVAAETLSPLEQQSRLEKLRQKWRKSRHAFDPDVGSGQGVFIVAESGWDRAANIAIVGLFVLAAGYTAYFTQAVLIPVILAWVAATIVLPVVKVLEKMGIPGPVAAITIAVALLALVCALIFILSVPITYWLGRASELGSLIRDKMRTIDRPMAFFGELNKALAQVTGNHPQPGGPDLPVMGEPANIVKGVLSFMTPVISQMILFFVGLVFYLIYQKDIRQSAVLFFADRKHRLVALRILGDIERNMTVYFGTFTLVNIALGVLTTALTYAAGLPNPLLWGVFAAIMNYIPYVGVAIVTTTLAVVGFLALPTLGQALIAPICYIGLTTLEGQFLTPTILGHRLTLNPYLVFLSIAFWTWMWGPMGAFLAVPLLMAGTVMAKHLMPSDQPELPA
jgi:predicted PurR-regulated permease PerM